MSITVEKPERPYTGGIDYKTLEEDRLEKILEIPQKMIDKEFKLPAADSNAILKKIKRSAGRQPNSSFEEAGVIADDYIYKEIKDGRNIGEALDNFKRDGILADWFPDSYDKFYAGVIKDVLSHDHIQFNPLIPDGAVSMQYDTNATYMLPTDEGGIYVKDISRMNGKEAYIVCFITDETLANTEDYNTFIKTANQYAASVSNGLQEMKYIDDTNFFSKKELDKYISNIIVNEKSFGNRYGDAVLNEKAMFEFGDVIFFTTRHQMPYKEAAYIYAVTNDEGIPEGIALDNVEGGRSYGRKFKEESLCQLNGLYCHVYAEFFTKKEMVGYAMSTPDEKIEFLQDKGILAKDFKFVDNNFLIYPQGDCYTMHYKAELPADPKAYTYLSKVDDEITVRGLTQLISDDLIDNTKFGDKKKYVVYTNHTNHDDDKQVEMGSIVARKNGWIYTNNPSSYAIHVSKEKDKMMLEMNFYYPKENLPELLSDLETSIKHIKQFAKEQLKNKDDLVIHNEKQGRFLLNADRLKALELDTDDKTVTKSMQRN